ncbi:MAG: hypothetical protein CGW95_10825 [Phenylobacterium zucineum]|nr:MAG: hypothetical protein CGW95_10825 [Phenylobacterium zucineum]
MAYSVREYGEEPSLDASVSAWGSREEVKDGVGGDGGAVVECCLGFVRRSWECVAWACRGRFPVVGMLAASQDRMEEQKCRVASLRRFSCVGRGRMQKWLLLCQAALKELMTRRSNASGQEARFGLLERISQRVQMAPGLCR